MLSFESRLPWLFSVSTLFLLFNSLTIAYMYIICFWSFSSIIFSHPSSNKPFFLADPSHFMPFLLCDPVNLTRVMCIRMEVV